MKQQAMIRTGMLPPHKVTRKQMADRIRKTRNKGFKMKRLAFNDARAYQSNDEYDTYMYAVII